MSVILFVEFTIGIAVIIAGFGYKHTYIVSYVRVGYIVMHKFGFGPSEDFPV